MSAHIARLGLVVTLLCGLFSGCTGFPDRRSQADSIVAMLRTTLGVQSVQPNYVNSIDLGASFEVTVDVRRSIVASTLADAGRRFVEEVDHGGFESHVVSLTVQLPETHYDPDQRDTFCASFKLTDDGGSRRKDVTADQVGADLHLWAQAMEFPGVTSVMLVRPAPQGSKDGQNRLIDVRVVDANAADAVQARYPELQGHL
jgi:hypothetical protein